MSDLRTSKRPGANVRQAAFAMASRTSTLVKNRAKRGFLNLKGVSARHCQTKSTMSWRMVVAPKSMAGCSDGFANGVFRS